MYQSLIITRDLHRYSPQPRFKRSNTKMFKDPGVPSYIADTIQSRNRNDMLSKVQKHVPTDLLSKDQLTKNYRIQKPKVKNFLGYRNFPDINEKRHTQQETERSKLQNFRSQPDASPVLRRRPILVDFTTDDMIVEILDYSPVRDFILKRKKSKVQYSKKKKSKQATLQQYKLKIKKVQNRIIGRIILLYYRLYRILAFSRSYAHSRRKEVEIAYSKISPAIEGLMKHYNVQLYYPLKFYRDIIKQYMENPSKHYNDQTLRFLNALMTKLKTTGLPVELFNFFKLISLHRSYIPRNFLSKFELKRIKLSKMYGCLKEPTTEQSLMIIGNFICQRIVCKKLILQPWNIKAEDAHGPSKRPFNGKKSKTNSTHEDNNPILQEDFHRYRKIVINIASAFNSIFVRHFYKNIECINNRTMLKKYGYAAAKTLNIFPDGYEEQLNIDEKEMGMGILSHLNKQYYRTLIKVDDERVEEIKEGMLEWLEKILQKIKVMGAKQQQQKTV